MRGSSIGRGGASPAAEGSTGSVVVVVLGLEGGEDLPQVIGPRAAPGADLFGPIRLRLIRILRLRPPRGVVRGRILWPSPHLVYTPPGSSSSRINLSSSSVGGGVSL